MRFEKAFGVDMDTLMRMQHSYDIARTRERARTITFPVLASSPGILARTRERARTIRVARYRPTAA